MQSTRTVPTYLFRALSMMLLLAILIPTLLAVSASRASAATTWSAATTTEANILNGLRYANGKWIAVGGYGHYDTSTDGTSWTATTLSGATTLNDVFYAGQWVIAGSLGKIYTSTDGSTWTSQTSHTSQNLWSLYSNGSTFVAVGDGGTIVTGSGTTWSAQTAGSQPFFGVTYGGGQFVAVGGAGTLYTSPDGIAWTNRTGATSSDLYAVGYGNGLYVAVGRGGVMLTSTDGVSWTSRTSGVSTDLNGVEYGAGKWVAVGNAGVILSSATGTTWSPETSGVSGTLLHVALGNGKWVAVGASGPTGPAVIVTQTAASNNASLSNLALSVGTLTPGFSAGTTSYTASVPYTTTTMDVTATLADMTASMLVNGTPRSSGTPFTLSPNVGSNTVTVAVTAEDGITTKTYTITITRATPSTNASLSNLTISSGTLTPGFSTGTTAYTATVANSVSSINVTPTVADSSATITVNGAAAGSGNPKSVSLSVGTNTITVVVTAQDGTTQKIYTLTVTRPGNNANLSGLTLSAGTLSPAFSSSTTTGYTASVPYSTSTLTVTPTLADNTATFTVNGTAPTSGKVDVPLNVGTNTVNVTVTAQDGTTTKTYTVTVTRAAASTNANLSGLTFDVGTLSPTFASGATSYSITVPYGTTSVNVTPTVADATATVKVNGTAATSGNAFTFAGLNVGDNTITVTVTAEDGTTTKEYVITAHRQSNDATLANLAVSAGTLSFASGTTSYTVTVDNAVTSIDVTPTVNHSAATLQVNGSAASSGSAATISGLNVGDNTVTVKVFAEDNTITKTYTIVVHRQSSDATLSGLTVSAGTLSPVFDPTKTGYDVTVASTVTSISVTPATNHGSATATVTGGGSLNIGANTVKVDVTAEDTHFTQTYTIVVHRQSNDATLANLAVSAGTLSFASGTTSYTVTVDNAVTSIDVTPTVNHSAATLQVKGSAVSSGSAATISGLNVGDNTVTVKVFAEDTAISQDYRIVVHRKSLDADLSGLTVNGGTLSQTFAANVTTYDVSVPHTATSVQLTPTTSHNLATLTVNGTPSTSGAPVDISLGVGATPVDVVVTPEEGTPQKTYTFVFWPAPVFTSGVATNTSQLISQGVGLTKLAATGVTGETLTYSLVSGSLPAGILVNTTDGTLSGTATTVGATSAVFQVADAHGGTDTTTLNVTVQEAPAFTTAPTNTSQVTSTGAGLTGLVATKATGETLTFSVASGTLPAGIQLDTSNGTFTGTATTAGVKTVVIEAADTHGGKASTTLDITVQQGPVFTADQVNTNQVIVLGMKPGALKATADVGQSMTFSLDSGTLPAGVTLNPDGTFSGAATAVGTSTVTIAVVDGRGGRATTTLTLGVNLPLVPPVITVSGGEVTTSTPTISGTATEMTGLDVSVTVDGASYSAPVVGKSWSVTVTAPLTVGHHSVSASGKSAQGLTGQASGEILVKANPVLAAPGDQTGTVGEKASVKISATGAPGSKLSYAASGLPEGLNIDPVTGAISGTPTKDGTYTVSITVKETVAGGTAAGSFTWKIAQAESLKITGPADGAPFATPPVVSGTLTGGGTVTVTVGGKVAGSATVGAPGGGWSVNLSGLADSLQVGPNTATATATSGSGKALSASVSFVYSPKGKLSGTVTYDGGGPAAGVSVEVVDAGGKSVAGGSTGPDGSFRFEALPAGNYSVRSGKASTQVTVAAGKEATANLTISTKVTISLSLSPSSLIGDGVSTGTLTLVATTTEGQPAVGITAQLSATAGSLSASSITTGADGRATATLTAPKLDGISNRSESVTASVRDATRGITADASAVISFVPASITGLIVDNKTGKPVAGAKVSVAEDFNGDGMIDFAAETTTAEDGTYKMFVPRGNWTYKTHVSFPTEIAGKQVTVETVHESEVGDITGMGQSFNAQRTVTGQLFVASSDKQDAQPPSQALTHGENITAVLTRSDTGMTTPVVVSPTGSYTVSNLEPGEYKLNFQLTAPTGEQLAGAAVTVSVNQDGEMSVINALIDPYGTVTDATTGEVIAGVTMKLMWADTPLNREKGRTPDSPVALPELPDFAPNQNRMPQVTTAAGKYAWMVFPDGDYYILAEKAGYLTYDSRQEGRNVPAAAGEDSYVQNGIIHVGQSLVSYDLSMLAASGQHKRYIQGYPDGTFHPDAPITRAEVATVLARLLGLDAQASNRFTDVPAEHWAARAIAGVAARGLMVGDPTGRFRPSDPVTRAEVAVIMGRLRKLTPAGNAFPDTAGHWAAGSIAAAKNAGILSGYPDGSFRPGRATTRAEFVTVINRTLGRGPLLGVGTATFADVPASSWAFGQVEEAATDHNFTRTPDGVEHP